MKKPVKPSRKIAVRAEMAYDEKLKKWIHTREDAGDDICGHLDGLTIREAIELLQQFDKDLFLKHNYGYDYAELVLQKVVKESIEEYNERLEKYEAEYADWKERKRKKLQKELDSLDD